MTEAWKPFPQDTRYEVSDLGRVRRADNHRLRKPVPIKSGYLTIQISRPGDVVRLHYVHRMVWETFNGPIPPGLMVRHGPGGSGDNRLTELRLGTQAQNIADKRRDGTEPTGERRWSSKLTQAQADEIRRRAGEATRALAAEFGVSLTTIHRVLRQETYA